MFCELLSCLTLDVLKPITIPAAGSALLKKSAGGKLCHPSNGGGKKSRYYNESQS